VARRSALIGQRDEETRAAERAMPELKARAKDLNELAEGATFLFKQRPLDMDEKAPPCYGRGAGLLARPRGACRAAEWTARGDRAGGARGG
jgi:glutamyl-tRNA synthetase